ncbi:right-handed parallel beta-helix repeat-containing protein [Geothrix campi]|uniref:right-handed parallel beta-helix repeat-containing protein n=1 Tax=Geothrix campi TaxID=2966450 RepID=UPI002147F06F|nr:right-handed parallel beta-helix repeat-containing protein [Geothrix sp. SG10]
MKTQVSKWFAVLVVAFGTVQAFSQITPFSETITKQEPGKVAKVANGELQIANAVWWGFDENDATRALQQAIDSKAKKVIVSNTGKPWIVGPITLRGNLELFIEPGVVIIAKSGLFMGTNDCLFRAVRQSNIQIHGYGSILKMRKYDYIHTPYVKGEWRHALSFDGCNNIEVTGILIQDSGGDGIYLGGASLDRGYCESVLIKDVTSNNNLRQGISVVSVKNLQIVHCIFQNTNGTPPAAGIDFEPNKPTDFLYNCLISDCYFSTNQGFGVLAYLGRLSSSSPKISIELRRCHIESNFGPGVAIGGISDYGPNGLLNFIDCQIANSRGTGLLIMDKSDKGALFQFENCRFENNGEHLSTSPIIIKLSKDSIIRHIGNIKFINCEMNDSRPRAIIGLEGKVSGGNFIEGTLRLSHPSPRAEASIKQFAPNLNIFH